MDMEGIGPLSESIGGSLETDTVEGCTVQSGGVLHEAANTVVGNGMHDDLFADHCRRSAAQNVHAHCDLDVPKEQLNGPSPEVQPAEFFNGPFGGVEQGG